ncbi:MAG: metallophosphoesterase [bacterium]
MKSRARQVILPVLVFALSAFSGVTQDKITDSFALRSPAGVTGRTLPGKESGEGQISVILGRPSDHTVTASVLSAEAMEGFCEYGVAPGNYSKKTGVVALASGKPVDFVLGPLPVDTACVYRLRYRKLGESVFTEGGMHSFHTQRAPGKAFVFEIQGDSHPERPKQHDSSLYSKTLKAAAADHPDFYMCIGDDFSVDTLHVVNEGTVVQRYLLQRPFLALVAQSAPLFLVNGNHEQASACNLDGTSNNVAVWAQNARNTYFPQPAPDGFYTGDTKPVPFIGLLRDYYAWTWGDALFVVIDPYWHSTKPVDNPFGGGEKSKDLWSVTLGADQYKWFSQTLKSSHAKFKFVFSHHVLGTGRGGIENASLGEWGGENRKGVNEFGRMRPDWEMPIHQLMATNGVTIFFQGHDHVFARQSLDGVVYQTLPEPADPSYTLYFKEAFRSGNILPNSGRVRVTVTPDKVTVEYIRSWLQIDVTDLHTDGEVAFRYCIMTK